MGVQHGAQVAKSGGEGLASLPPLNLQFPRRDIVEETLRVFALNPFGFFPKAAFWREVGMTSAREMADIAVKECVVSGAILPPDMLWGVPRGHLPGPRLFTASVRIPAIPRLSPTPSREEIEHNSRVRVIEKVAYALVDERGKPTITRLCSGLGIDPSLGATLLEALIKDGFLERKGSVFLPTEKTQEWRGHPDLIARVGGDTAAAPVKAQPRHRMLQELREQVLAEKRETLVSMVRGTAGLTASELFKQTSGTVIPADITRNMFETMLSTLVKEKALVTAVRRTGTVQRVLVYMVPAV